MTDWNEGYITEIGYTYGYYTELNPLRVQLAFLNKGLAFPEIKTACELGFGQGMSVNIHAAASDIAWYGTDFNAAQASFAQNFAKGCSLNATLFDDSFEDFCRRDDLPDFDYIGLHGIWSWISDENKQHIVDFVRKKLRVGGVLYISYNVLPGWGTVAPIRHLMMEYTQSHSEKGRGIIGNVQEAVAFAKIFVEANSAYTRANPSLAPRVEQMSKKDAHYLAHEYFNKDWTPIYFSEMAQWLSQAKLDYACSAHFPDHVDAVNLSPEQQSFLNEYKDTIFHETLRDFLVNQQFRRDYWVKGARRLDLYTQKEELRKQRFILVSPRENVEMKVKGAQGDATLQESIYSPVLDYLADHRIHSVVEMEEALKKKNIVLAQLSQALLILTGTGHLACVNSDDVIDSARESTKRCNDFIRHLSKGLQNMSYHASPVTGGGVMVNRFNQLFLLGKNQGCKTTAELANFVWSILNEFGQKISKDGETLTSDKDNLKELERHAEEFMEKSLKIFEALQIV